MANIYNYQSNYSKLVEVQILHDYFSDQKCSSFEILPDSYTLSQLKNYELLFKSTRNGFVLIGKQDDRFSGQQFKGEILLRFHMKLVDELFLNYTQLPFQRGRCYRFTNKFDQEVLHSKPFVDESCLNGETEKLWEGEITLQLNSENELFGYQSGTREQSIQAFRIQFQSREVQLRYNFYSTNPNVDIADYYIENEDKSHVSNGFEERVLANGKTVFSIEYQEFLKLKQENSGRMKLKRNGNFLNTYTVDLPFPNLKNVSFDRNQEKFYADMFISLD